MQTQLLKKSLELMENQHFSCLAVGVLDFSKNKLDFFEISDKKNVSIEPHLFFDLASLTKPLTLAATYHLHPEIFNEEMINLLNHRAGLPSHGRLSSNDWREHLLSFQIVASETLYSDYSPLRLMLEIEKKMSKKLKEICSVYWDQELVFWKDLDLSAVCPATGFRRGRPIIRQVHDDKAYSINEFTSHAGLFATVRGLGTSLINLNKKTDFVNVMKNNFRTRKDFGRFLCGWDTVSDPSETMAGIGCSKNTFGHLGFTGTSVWIDTESGRGSIILTNATENYWYDRSGLKLLRQSLGQMIWNS
jgi:CubicO group peptidase (beta-lactamase class C family)